MNVRYMICNIQAAAMQKAPNTSYLQY